MSKTNSQQPSQDVIVWAMACGVCLLLFGALFWVLGPGQSARMEGEGSTQPQPNGPRTVPIPQGMMWPKLTLTRSALLASRQDKSRHASSLPQEVKAQESVKRFYDMVALMNDHQFTTQPIPSKTPEQLDYDYRTALGLVLEHVRPEEFMELGRPVFEQCKRGLGHVQRAIAQGDTTLEQAKQDADYETFAVYRRHCGNMLTSLDEQGLVDGKGAFISEEAELMASILERYRWAHLVDGYIEPLEQLTSYERAAFVRWRVEQSKGFDTTTKRRFLKTLYEEIPSYPEGVPEAMFAYEEGNLRRAAEILSRYRNRSPDDPTYNTMYRALEEELMTR